ncbi:hypothetical protein GMOD_00009373 [Pyrenophora seminiperda CCB06]|nr:hypothetical protein GMOD_00009373 [Pyrenophora seminiperda CCB06]
MQVLRAC